MARRKGVGSLGICLRWFRAIPDGRFLIVLTTLGGVAVVLMWLWDSALDWTWGRLGYAWVPTLLWISPFVLVLRYRRFWIGAYWRVWISSAFLATAIIGTLSLLGGVGGIPEEARLGGQWGESIVGSPKWFGILKVGGLLTIALPILSPQRAGGAYKHCVRALLFAIVQFLCWTMGYGGKFVGTVLKKIRLVPAKRGWKTFVSKLARSHDRQLAPTQPNPELNDHAHGTPTTSQESQLGPEDSVPESTKYRNLTTQPDHNKIQIYGWHLPPLNILEKGATQGVSHAEPSILAQHIITTLAEHSVEVEVKDIRVGPRVIRFGLVPGWVSKGQEGKSQRSAKGQDSSQHPDSLRVKVNTILAREKDLALALKTPHIRIEAPVPGEAIVGLEVPNPNPSTVQLRSVAESPLFQRIMAKGGLPIALGQDTAGASVVVDLLDLPHLLIAGATGSGKSVCINAVLTSLLLSNRPDRLRLLMMDPKRVELTPFNGIPHLVTQVIVDSDNALQSLRGVVGEMFRRYKIMEEMGVRNIAGYNRKSNQQMPFLVVVVDELADLMLSSAYEAEQALVRLAQLGRATGVHLLLSTQRPSVNVVTGLLKANIPARIAFAVASQVDSRVVLDGVGAERLLGRGDMLFHSQGSPKPIRVQGALVGDVEIEGIVDYWKEQRGSALPPILLEEFNEHQDPNDDDDSEDDLLNRARKLADRLPRLSVSVLQRRLQIGYSKAVELTEQLEQEGTAVRR